MPFDTGGYLITGVKFTVRGVLKKLYRITFAPETTSIQVQLPGSSKQVKLNKPANAVGMWYKVTDELN